jgi:hypothetical protein
VGNCVLVESSILCPEAISKRAVINAPAGRQNDTIGVLRGGPQREADLDRFEIVWVPVQAAPSFVCVGVADEHPRVAVNCPLAAVGRLAADHTDGQHLLDVLSDCAQVRNGLERAAQVVHIERSHDDQLSLVGQGTADVDQPQTAELRFANADDEGVTDLGR